jgi:hypothetical protein
MLPMSLSDNGRSVDTLVALDNMVHPDYQRRGILKELEKLIVVDRPNDIPFYTFLNENSFYVYTQRFDWNYLGPIDVYFKPVSLSTFVAKNRLYKAFEIPVKLYSLIYRPNRKLGVERIDNYDQTIENLWINNRNNLGITFNRSVEYLNWRFIECPVDYVNLKIVDGGNVVGFVVLRIQKKFGFKICWIMDLLTDGEVEKEHYRDILLAIQDIVKDKCDFITTLLPREDVKRSIKSAGYLKIPNMLFPHQFYFCVRQNGYHFPEINNIANWYFSWSLNDVL